MSDGYRRAARAWTAGGGCRYVLRHPGKPDRENQGADFGQRYSRHQKIDLRRARAASDGGVTRIATQALAEPSAAREIARRMCGAYGVPARARFRRPLP